MDIGDSENFSVAAIHNLIGKEGRGIKRKRVDDIKTEMAAHLKVLGNAISADDVTSVADLLEKFPDTPFEDMTVGPFDFRSNKCRFPLLHFAAREGSVNVLRYLVEEKGLNINKFTKAAGTPLSRAVHSSHDACVELLLQAGCDVNKKVPVCQIRECRVNLVTPLMIAVSRETPEIVKRILDSGRCHVNATAGFRETALYFAIKHPTHSLQYVEMLLAAGIRPNIQSTIDEPPLLLALKLQNTDIAKLLISHGCNVNATKESPASFDITALHMAAEMDNVELVRHLIDAGANLNARMDVNSTLGTTPLLHCVAGNRCYNTMSVLLEAGSDVKAVDKFGRNICHWLVLNGDDRPLFYVLARFKSVEIEKPADDENNTTPMDYAIMINNSIAVKTLLFHNCQVRKICKNQTGSPLDFAIQRGFTDLLPCLHQAGCDITEKTIKCLNQKQNNGVDGGIHPAIRHNRSAMDWLKRVAGKPRSLLDISRLAVRDNLSSNISKELSQLELPGLLKQFVLNIESRT